MPFIIYSPVHGYMYIYICIYVTELHKQSVHLTHKNKNIGLFLNICYFTLLKKKMLNTSEQFIILHNVLTPFSDYSREDKR